MAKTRVFISFDYDHDKSLKDLLVGQAKHSDSPFSIADWSFKEAQATDWQSHARMRIAQSDVVAVICGEHTDSAAGVSTEIKIANELGIPYFLLWGYSGKTCKRPKSASSSEKIYDWTWSNLKSLIGGSR